MFSPPGGTSSLPPPPARDNTSVAAAGRSPVQQRAHHMSPSSGATVPITMAPTSRLSVTSPPSHRVGSPSRANRTVQSPSQTLREGSLAQRNIVSPSTGIFAGPGTVNSSALVSEVEQKRHRIAEMEQEHVQRLRELSHQKAQEQKTLADISSVHAAQISREWEQARVDREDASAAAAVQVARTREVALKLQEAERKIIELRATALKEEEGRRTAQRELEAAQRENQDLKAGADNVLQGKVAALSQLLESKNSEVSESRAQVNQLKDQLEKERETRLDTAKNCETLKTELTKSEVILAECERERMELKRHQQALEQRIEKEMAMRREAEERQHQQEVDLERKLTESREELRGKGKQVAALELKEMSLVERSTLIEDERDRLDQEKKKLQAQLDSSKGSLQQSIMKGEGLEAKVAQLNLLTESQQQAIDRHKTEASGLRTQLEEASVKMSTQQDKLCQLEVETQRIGHLNETLRVQKSSLERQQLDRVEETRRYDELSRKYLLADEQLRTAKVAVKQLHERESEIEALERSKNALQEKFDRTSLSLDDARREIDDYRRRLRVSKEETTVLFAERQGLDAKNAELRQRVAEHDALSARAETLAMRLQESTNKSTELADTNAKLESELVTYKAKVTHLTTVEETLHQVKDDHSSLMEVVENQEMIRKERESLIVSLEGLVRERDEQFDDSQQELLRIETQMGRLISATDELKRSREENIQLNERLDAARTELESCLIAKEGVEGEKNQLKGQLDCAHEATATLEKELSRVRSEMQELQRKLGHEAVLAEEAIKAKKAAEALQTTAEAQLHTVGTALDEVKGSIEAVRGELTRSTQECEHVSEELSQLQRNYRKLQDRESNLQRQYDELHAKHADLQEVHTSSMAKVERNSILEGKISALEAVVLRKETDLRKSESALVDLRGQYHTAESKVVALERSEAKVQNLKEKVTSLEELLHKAEEEGTRKSNDLIAKEQDIQRSTSEISLLRDSLAFEQNLVKKLENDNANQRQELLVKAQLEGKITALTALVSELETQCRGKEEEIEKLRVELLEHAAAPSADAVHESVARELEQYKRQAAVHVEMITTLEEDYAVRTSAQQRLSREKEDAERRATDATNELEKLRNTHNELERTHRHLVEDHEYLVTQTEETKRRTTLDQNKLFALADEYNSKLEGALKENEQFENRVRDLEHQLAEKQSELAHTEHTVGSQGVELEVITKAAGEYKTQLAVLNQTVLAEREEKEQIKNEFSVLHVEYDSLQGRVLHDASARSVNDSSTETVLSEYKNQLSNLHELLSDKTARLQQAIAELQGKHEQLVEKEQEIDQLKASQMSMHASLAMMNTSLHERDEYLMKYADTAGLRSPPHREHPSKHGGSGSSSTAADAVKEITLQENEILIANQAAVIADLEKQLAHQKAQPSAGATTTTDSSSADLKKKNEALVGKCEKLEEELDAARYELGFMAIRQTSLSRIQHVSSPTPATVEETEGAQPYPPAPLPRASSRRAVSFLEQQYHLEVPQEDTTTGTGTGTSKSPLEEHQHQQQPQGIVSPFPRPKQHIKRTPASFRAGVELKPSPNPRRP